MDTIAVGFSTNDPECGILSELAPEESCPHLKCKMKLVIQLVIYLKSHTAEYEAVVSCQEFSFPARNQMGICPQVKGRTTGSVEVEVAQGGAAEASLVLWPISLRFDS